MSFMKRVLEQNIPIWEDCIETPFLQELKNGALSEEKFSGYMLQDCIYLKYYAKVFGRLIFGAKDWKEIQMYYAGLGFVADGEAEKRLRYQQRFEEKQPGQEKALPENQRYIDFLMGLAEQGNDAEMLMAVLPCMLSYSYIFRKLQGKSWLPDFEKNLSGASKTNGRTDRSRQQDRHETAGKGDLCFKSIFEAYAAEAYVQECGLWCAFADKKCEGMSIQKLKRLEKIFLQGSLLELAFWRMDYGI